MAEDATPLVEALVAIIDAARAYLPPEGSARTLSSPRCSRRLTIRELSRRSQCMVIRWRGEGAEPASARPLKPLGSASVGFYGRHGPRAKARAWRIQRAGCGGRLRDEGNLTPAGGFSEGPAASQSRQAGAAITDAHLRSPLAFGPSWKKV
jgi:hypothetical protein